MKQAEKSKEQLIDELTELKQNIVRLEDDSKRVEDALRESEASMKSILKAAPIGIGLLKFKSFQYTRKMIPSRPPESSQLCQPLV